jgi:hypothetical protein
MSHCNVESTQPLAVEREHDGVGRRIDAETDNVAQLVDELLVIRR